MTCRLAAFKRELAAVPISQFIPKPSASEQSFFNPVMPSFWAVPRTNRDD